MTIVKVSPLLSVIPPVRVIFASVKEHFLGSINIPFLYMNALLFTVSIRSEMVDGRLIVVAPSAVHLPLKVDSGAVVTNVSWTAEYHSASVSVLSVSVPSERAITSDNDLHAFCA